MTIDIQLLESARSFDDLELGVHEEFVELHAGGAPTVGVLSRPISGPAKTAFLICHAFGTEQVQLQITEVQIARSLGAAGHIVLRYQGQGYGDSGDIDRRSNFSSHVHDALDALEQLRSMTRVTRIGVLGARFGAAVAGAVAARSGADLLTMIAPVTRGDRYVAEMLRTRVITQLIDDPSGEVTSTTDPRNLLETEGVVTVKGFALHADVAAELSSVDLLRELAGFKGRALVVQVSRGDSIQPVAHRLVAQLREQGTIAEIRVANDRFAPNFGNEHFEQLQPGVLTDSLTALNMLLVNIVGAWVAAGERV